ncbi:unnamed protein product [Vitrella brassicaformis CCMP3155]|uniref:Uncharacterized protein n=1 Tax=Vitrella brassicaformis (strain CCMP3155) TaxID=1169540 RepID=A0A0G4EUP7_VITBC|nr:unnamed protein product [Vitrella brassicaformis CCMP3155]|eukprot:CEM02174.1 unnamed protein product [Vitrella brassicaformis CCMP3155]
MSKTTRSVRIAALPGHVGDVPSPETEHRIVLAEPSVTAAIEGGFRHGQPGGDEQQTPLACLDWKLDAGTQWMSYSERITQMCQIFQDELQRVFAHQIKNLPAVAAHHIHEVQQKVQWATHSILELFGRFFLSILNGSPSTPPLSLPTPVTPPTTASSPQEGGRPKSAFHRPRSASPGPQMGTHPTAVSLRPRSATTGRERRDDAWRPKMSVTSMGYLCEILGELNGRHHQLSARHDRLLRRFQSLRRGYYRETNHLREMIAKYSIHLPQYLVREMKKELDIFFLEGQQWLMETGEETEGGDTAAPSMKEKDEEIEKLTTEKLSLKGEIYRLQKKLEQAQDKQESLQQMLRMSKPRGTVGGGTPQMDASGQFIPPLPPNDASVQCDAPPTEMQGAQCDIGQETFLNAKFGTLPSQQKAKAPSPPPSPPKHPSMAARLAYRVEKAASVSIMKEKGLEELEEWVRLKREQEEAEVGEAQKAEGVAEARVPEPEIRRETVDEGTMYDVDVSEAFITQMPAPPLVAPVKIATRERAVQCTIISAAPPAASPAAPARPPTPEQFAIPPGMRDRPTQAPSARPTSAKPPLPPRREGEVDRERVKEGARKVSVSRVPPAHEAPRAPTDISVSRPSSAVSGARTRPTSATAEGRGVAERVERGPLGRFQYYPPSDRARQTMVSELRPSSSYGDLRLMSPPSIMSGKQPPVKDLYLRVTAQKMTGTSLAATRQALASVRSMRALQDPFHDPLFHLDPPSELRLT